MKLSDRMKFVSDQLARSEVPRTIGQLVVDTGMTVTQVRSGIEALHRRGEVQRVDANLGRGLAWKLRSR